MAVISGTADAISPGAFAFDWDAMGGSDTGTPVGPPAQRRASVHVTGGPGVIQMEGSNDAVNWRNIGDLSGLGGAVANGKLVALQILPLQVRPRVVSGSDLRVRLVASRHFDVRRGNALLSLSRWITTEEGLPLETEDLRRLEIEK